MPLKRNKKNNNFIVGLDVGTTKICAIVADVFPDHISIQNIKTKPSMGLRKGIVVDIDAASESIRNVISEISKQGGREISRAIVGIAGSHIKSFNGYGAIGIKRNPISFEDIERAIESASAAYVPLDREKIHVIPYDFIIDGQRGIKDPVGMHGSRLEVLVHIITGAITAIQNLLLCCERAGLEVSDIVLQPIASSEATLTEMERMEGTVLVDIGGGTTDIAIYKDGWLKHTSILGIGGNHFTNDLSVGLNIPFHEAEDIKKKVGFAITDNKKVLISINKKNITLEQIKEILEPRAEELLDLIKTEVNNVYKSGISVSGAVLTGGASLLEGFERLAESILSMPVRIGYPIAFKDYSDKNQEGITSSFRIIGLIEEYNNPMYSTGIGLVLCGMEHILSLEVRSGNSENLFDTIIDKMKEWFKRLV